MSVKAYHLNFRLFTCASHLKISSFFLARVFPFYSYFCVTPVHHQLQGFGPLACSFLPEIIIPSRLWSVYISSPFRFVIKNFFLGSLLSSFFYICSLQFILYCINFSLILKMPNCSLMSLLLFFVPKCISCH
jgi:hypothetical protein